MIRLVTNIGSVTFLALQRAARHLHCDMRSLVDLGSDEELLSFNPAGAIVFLYGAPQAAASTVLHLKSLGIRVAVWQVDDPHYFRSPEHRASTIRAASAADAYFSHTDQLTQEYRALGVEVTYLPTGAREVEGAEHLACRPADEGELDLDFSFVGTLSPTRRAFWEELGSLLPNQLRGRAFERVALAEAHRIYRHTRVNLAFGQSADLEADRSWGVTERAWEAPLTGGFLLQDERKHLRDHFEIGVDAVTFSTARDCADKILHFLAHPDDRRAKAERAQQRVWSEHLLQHRLLVLLRKLLRVPREDQPTIASATAEHGDRLPAQFPVFVVCRDRLAPLRRLLDWLARAGQHRVFLVDNDSSYPPLLQFFKTTPHTVIRLGKNLGHTAPWRAGVLERFAGDDYYVVSDPDVVPADDCPLDALDRFRSLLDHYPEIAKVGFGLKIDDLPDCFEYKARVLCWERQFWANEASPGVYRAPIDTTFALYRPRAGHERDRCLRTGPPYVARHLPWYEDSANLSEETRFYRERADSAIATWSFLPNWLRSLTEPERETARSPEPQTIALLVPVTSRGRRIARLEEADLFRKLIPSFLRTASWNGDFRYRIYVGYDVGDPFFDRPGIADELGAAFRAVAGGRSVELVSLRCEATDHAPCRTWNVLFQSAWKAGCDYFFQLGDCVELATGGWAPAFVGALSSDADFPGIGVTGPRDVNRSDGVLTQSFVSRVHMDIFGSYFPLASENWWSDDWITQAYAPLHVHAPSVTQLVTSVGGPPRYVADEGGRQALDRFVVEGRAAVARWIHERGTRPVLAGREVVGRGLHVAANVDPYGTHFPVLAAACARSQGPILELGCGDWSTPMLHEICRATGRRLVTLDNDATWLARFRDLEAPWHELRVVGPARPGGEEWEAARVIDEAHWGVALVDHRPAERRRFEIARLAHNTDYVVVHDTEDSTYGYESVLATFKWRYDFKRFLPWSSVASNVRSFAAHDEGVPALKIERLGQA